MREKGFYDVIGGVVSPMGDFSHSDSEPIWRQNGYQLRFDADSNDYLDFNNEKIILNQGDYLEFSFYNQSTGSNQTFTTTTSGLSKSYITRLGSNNRIFIQGEDGQQTLTTLLFVDGVNNLRIEKVASGFDVTLNGVTQNTTVFTSFNYQYFFKASFVFADAVLYHIDNGETFDFKESTGNTITGSSGTVATINTSDSGGTEYDRDWETKQHQQTQKKP